MNIYDFSDKINSDRSVRENFIKDYVRHLVESTDSDDIVQQWSAMMYEQFVSEVKEYGADGIVEDVARDYPEWLKKKFKVDPALAPV